MLTFSQGYMLHCSHSAKATHCYIAHIQPRLHIVTLLTFSQGYTLLQCSHSAQGTHCYIAHIQPRLHVVRAHIQPGLHIVTLLTFSQGYTLLHCSHSAKATHCYNPEDCHIIHKFPSIHKTIQSERFLSCYNLYFKALEGNCK
jgi:hypothetical protein